MNKQIAEAHEWLSDLSRMLGSTNNPEYLRERMSLIRGLVETAEYADSLEKQYEQLHEENKRLEQFYNYFAKLYGQGLEIAEWHKNGDLEPFDYFFDSAEEHMEEEEA